MAYKKHFFPSQASRQVFVLLFFSILLLVFLLDFALIHLHYGRQAAIHAGHSALSSRPWLLFMLLSIIIFIIVLVFLLSFFIKRLAIPVNIFTQAAHRLGLSVAVNDIPETGDNESRLAAQAFNEMNARIQRLLSERTQMVAAISHDLRSPITRMKIRAEHLLEPKIYEKFLTDLNEMEALSNQILEYAEQETHVLNKERFDVAELLNELCQELINIGHSVYYEGQNMPLPLYADRKLLKRAIANVISNASKYGELAKVTLHYDDQFFFIQIDDVGPGIPEDQLDKVFIPFYRVDKARTNKKGGTGLGLIIAKQGIVANNGKIELQNIKPNGLRALIRFSMEKDL